MTVTPNASLAELSGTARHRVESLLVEFDQSWDEHRLAACASALPRDCEWRLAALVEMVKIDLEKQWRNSRQPRVEAYLHFYPELATAGSAVAELLLAEYQARQAAGQTAELADFARRFPAQADALRKLVNQEQSSRSAANAAGKQTDGDRPETHPSNQPATPSDLPKRFGRYRIVKKLGEGGMGAVYLGEDTQLDRRVALKVPRLSKKENSAILQRFLREARAAATLRHPNICPVYDVGEVEGVPYLTMAHIEGRPLARFLRPDKPLPPRQTVLLVRKLALALQKAHEQGVVHRDLKPSNIMIDQQREPVIMDFGLAQRVNTGDARLTRVGSVLGTPAYMSPEQARGEVEAMGPCCDIYSLGVILYECLTGRLPFEGPPQVVIANVLTQEPPRPSTLRAGVDPRLEAVCLRAMAKKPEDRFPSMQAFADALGQYLAASAAQETQHPPTSAGQTGDPDADPFGDLPIGTPDPMPPSRNRSLTALAMVGVMAVAAVAFGIIIFVRSDEYGAVKIELPDGATGVTVEVDGGTILLKGLDQPIRLKAGKHNIEVRGKDFKTFTREITLTAGGKEEVKVTLEPAVATPVGKKPPVSPDPGVSSLAVAPFPAAEAKKHQQRWADQLKKPVVFTNSVQMKLVLIPAGVFEMGASNGDDNEKPPHRVTISKPFYMGVYEVTQAEYEAITGTNLAADKGATKPAQGMSWEEANAFCKELGKREGRVYRLPTEAEWEWACRAGTQTAWSFGNNANEIDDYGWHNGTSPKYPQPVGLKKPNPFGLYDMHGNVWEFCSDWYDSYTADPVTDPRGPELGKYRVFRGGSQYFPVWESRSSNRPDRQFPARGSNLGFRALCEIPGPDDKLEPPKAKPK